MTDGQDVEREVRRQVRERARRGGPSTAALEADLWFEILQHCEDMSVSAVVREFGPLVELLTGISSELKQREIVSAARKSKGSRLFLGSWGGFGDAAERGLAQAVAEAQEEYAAEHEAKLSRLEGAEYTGLSDEELYARRRFVLSAVGKNAAERLKAVNAALAGAGYKPISRREYFRLK